MALAVRALEPVESGPTFSGEIALSSSRRARAIGFVAFAGIIAAASAFPRTASAALFAGNQIQIGWTGNTAFGPFVNNGAGTAASTYTAPMGGTAFTTSPYASSTDMRTSVQDTNISITNNSFGFVPPQWFEYVDVNNTLPDFRTLTFTLDPVGTTDTSFNLSTMMQVQENAIALEFAEVPTGKTVSINIAVPEPASIGLIGACALVLLGARRRAHRH